VFLFSSPPTREKSVERQAQTLGYFSFLSPTNSENVIHDAGKPNRVNPRQPRNFSSGESPLYQQVPQIVYGLEAPLAKQSDSSCHLPMSEFLCVFHGGENILVLWNRQGSEIAISIPQIRKNEAMRRKSRPVSTKTAAIS